MTVSVTTATVNGLTCYQIVSKDGMGVPRWGVAVPQSLGALAYGQIPAPIQAVLRRSGTWSTVPPSPLALYDPSLNVAPIYSLGYSLTSLTTTVSESGPLRSRVKLRYAFDRHAVLPSVYGGLPGPSNANPPPTTTQAQTLTNSPGTAGTTLTLNPPYPTPGWPTTNGFYLATSTTMNQGEILKVTGGAGTLNLTVTRAVAGTAANLVAGNNVYLGFLDTAPTGDGYYECDVTVRDDKPFVEITDSCNAGFAYHLELNEGVAADTAYTMIHSAPLPDGYVRFSNVQQIVLGQNTSGSFTLTLNGQTTSSISLPATAASIQSALEGLSGVGAGNVLVALAVNVFTGGTSSETSPLAFNVAFRLQKEGTFYPLMSATGTGVTVSTNSLTTGEVYLLKITSGNGSPPAGSFLLSYGGANSTQITIDGTNQGNTATNILGDSTHGLTGLLNTLYGSNGVCAVRTFPDAGFGSNQPSNAYYFYLVLGNQGATTNVGSGTQPLGYGNVIGSPQPTLAITAHDITPWRYDWMGSYQNNVANPAYAGVYNRVDLTANQVRDYGALQPWADIAGGTGPASWLFFQKAAATSADAVGVLGGKPSLSMLGGGQGVTPKEAPALDDFDLRVDSSGNIHVIWKEWLSDVVWYQKWTSAYAAAFSSPVQVGAFETPYLMVRSATDVVVCGYNWSAQVPVVYRVHDGGSGSATVTADAFSIASGTFAPASPFYGPLLETNGTDDFLILTGAWSSTTAYHLFFRSSTATAGTPWFHATTSGTTPPTISGGSDLRVSRPKFFTNPADSSNLWLYTSSGGNWHLEKVSGTSLVSGGTTHLQTQQARGCALDRATGNFLASDGSQNCWFYTAGSDTWTSASLSTNGDRYNGNLGNFSNRDNLADSGSGTRLGCFNGFGVRYASSAWAEATGAETTANFAGDTVGNQTYYLRNKYEDQVVYNYVTAWNGTSSKILMLARANGQLTLWDSTDGASFTSQVTQAVRASVSIKSAGQRGISQSTYYQAAGVLDWSLLLATVDDVGPAQYYWCPGNFQQHTNRSGYFCLDQVNGMGLGTPPAMPLSPYQPLATFQSTLNKIATRVAPPTGITGYATYYAWVKAVDTLTGNGPVYDALANNGAFDGNGNPSAVVTTLTNFWTDMVHQLYNGIGPFSDGDGAPYQYIGPGKNFLYYWWYARVLLAYPWVAHPLSASTQTFLKTLVAFGAYLCNSNDFAPLQQADTTAYTGVNLDWSFGPPTFGTPNMPVQMGVFRNSFALAYQSLPAFATTASQVAADSLSLFHAATDANGSSIGSTSYMGATLTPTLRLLLQVKQNGTDNFASDPTRFNGTGNFLLNILTPATYRLNAQRIITPFGDATEDVGNALIMAMLAAGVKTSNATLASNLVAAWQALGAPMNDYYGGLVGLLDDTITPGSMNLATTQQPGYYMAQRFGFGTANETVVWGLWGNTYYDHRHEDQGHLSAVALNCPLLIDWSSEYAVHMADAYVHNVVVPVATLTLANWYDTLTSGNYGTSSTPGTNTQTQDLFYSFPNSACMQGTVTLAGNIAWSRKVRTVAWNAANPVILVEDTFGGDVTAKVVSFNISATGSVSIPGGSMTPTVNFYGVNIGGAPQQYPSGGTPTTTSAVVNKFTFTGPKWQQSTAKSISTDVYAIVPTGTESWIIGGWGFAGTSPGAATYYNAAGNGTPYTESFTNVSGTAYREQCHVFRRNGTNPFTTLFASWVQSAGTHWTVTQPATGHIQLTSGSETLDLYTTTTASSVGYASYTNGNATPLLGLALYDAVNTPSAYGLSLSGGPSECTVNQATPTATATVHDTADRTVSLTLPAKAGGGNWTPGTPSAGLSVSGTSPNFILTYLHATANGPASVNFS